MARSAIEKAIIACARTHGGIVTTWDMKARGFSSDSLRQWAYNHGSYDKFGRGIYWFGKINEQEDVDVDDATWFMSLAQSGDPEAYIAGSSVLDFYNLGYASPFYTLIRARTSRKHVANAGVLVEPADPQDQIDMIRGIRLQRLSQAFTTATDMREDYLSQAASDAYERNLLTGNEYDRISQKLRSKMKEAA